MFIYSIFYFLRFEKWEHLFGQNIDSDIVEKDGNILETYTELQGFREQCAAGL